MKRIGLLFLLAGVLSLVLIRGIGFAEDNPQASTQEVRSKATVTPAVQPQPSEAQGTPAIVQPSAEPVIVPPVKAPEMQEGLPTTTTELETQWVWGEITALDPQNKELTINYFDYETDTEKELKLSMNDNTKYENINSINDLKLHDTISVDYILGADGKYTARNISVEKPEESAAPAGKTEDKAAAVSGMEMKPAATTP
jgi:hypothetical protein